MVLYFITIGLYGLLAAHVWLKTSNKQRSYLSLLLAVATWISHGILLYQIIFPGRAVMVFGFATAVSLMFWFVISLYALPLYKEKMLAIPRLLFPLSGFAVLLPLWHKGQVLSWDNQHWMLYGHFVMANLASGLLFLVACQALLLRAAETQLRPGMRLGWISKLWLQEAKIPALLAAESCLFKQTFWGFICLTLAIVLGFLSALEFSTIKLFTHKTIFSCLAWLLLFYFFCKRYRLGWRGRPAWRLLLIAWASLLLSYIGSRFVLEILLQRHG